MAPTTKSNGASGVRFVRIETADAQTRVTCAGANWAGITEVPLASLSPAQIQQLSDDPRLKISDAESRPAPAAAA